MLTREITRQGFGTARALAFPELIAAPTFPAPLRAALEALEAECLGTLAEVFVRLREAIERGDDPATVEARRALTLTAGLSVSGDDSFPGRAQAFVADSARILEGPLTPALLGDYLGYLAERVVVELGWTRAWADQVEPRCGHLRSERLGSIAATQAWFEDLDPARLQATVAAAIKNGVDLAAEDVWLWRYDAEQWRGLLGLLRNGQSVSAALWEGLTALLRWAGRVGPLARRAEEAARTADEGLLAAVVEEWTKRTFQDLKHTRIGLNRALTELARGACAEEREGTRPGMRSMAVGFALWLGPRALDLAGWDAALKALGVSFPDQHKTLAGLSREKFEGRFVKRLTSELEREERRYGLAALPLSTVGM